MVIFADHRARQTAFCALQGTLPCTLVDTFDHCARYPKDISHEKPITASWNNIKTTRATNRTDWLPLILLLYKVLNNVILLL